MDDPEPQPVLCTSLCEPCNNSSKTEELARHKTKKGEAYSEVSLTNQHFPILIFPSLSLSFSLSSPPSPFPTTATVTDRQMALLDFKKELSLCLLLQLRLQLYTKKFNPGSERVRLQSLNWYSSSSVCAP